MDHERTGSDQVKALRRWQDAGGTWRVVARSAGRTPERVTVSLCRCDGGEEVDRFTSTDPELLRFLGDRSDSEC